MYKILSFLIINESILEASLEKGSHETVWHQPCFFELHTHPLLLMKAKTSITLALLFKLTMFIALAQTSTNLTITSYTLVNADTEQDIQVLHNGDVLNYQTLPTRNLSIRADAPASVESIRFSLTGPLAYSRTENLLPYALFGDTAGPNYATMPMPVGSYTLTCTPYSLDKLQGTVGTVNSISFTIIDDVAPSVSMTSPANNAGFNSGSTITLTANATDTDGTISKVEFYKGSTLLGSDTTADASGNFSLAWPSVASGSYSITAIAYDNQNLSTKSTAVSIKVTEPISATSAKKTYYVSNSDPNADDNGAGTIDHPWKTLDKVNAFVKTSVHQPGDWIVFKRGDTFNGQIYVNKSGTAVDRIGFGAYGSGNKPVISGFQTISSWTSAGSGVYYSTLSNNCSTILFSGSVKGKARFPRGEYNFLKYESNTATTITDNDIPATTSWVGATAIIRHGGQKWIKSKVTAQSGGTLTIEGANGFDPNFGYFFVDHPRCLTTLGDWRYDDAQKRIYVYFGTNSPSSYTVKAPCAGTGIKMSAKSYVTIADMTVEGFCDQGVYISYNSSYDVVQNSEFRYCDDGIGMDQSDHITLRNNSVHDCPNRGFIGFHGTNTLIEGNTFQNIGMINGAGDDGSSSYSGLYFEIGSGITIRLNRITKVGFIGIRFPRGHNNLVEKNVINGYGYSKDDNGAIYAWQGSDTTAYTNRIARANIILDGRPEGALPANGARRQSGLYADVNAHSIKWEGNVVVNPYGYGYLALASTIGHVLKDNIFYNASRYGMFTRAQIQQTYSGFSMTGNVVVIQKGQITDSVVYVKTYHGEFPSMIFSNNHYISEYLTPFQNAIGDPVTGVVKSTRYNLSGWQALGKDSGSTWSLPPTESRCEYNDTSATKTISFAGKKYKDIKTGLIYADSITLQPFTGVVLVSTP